MKIFQKQEFDKIIVALKKDETMVFPTETSYGLGCDATNQAAVDKVFKIKGRPADKPLLVLASDIKMAKKYLLWDGTVEKVAGKYWPGALTIVANYERPFWGKGLARGVVAADNTVAARVTADEWLNKLVKKYGRPIVATSANISGADNVYDIKEIESQFTDKEFQPDILVDGGVLLKRSPTTLVSVADDKIKILRQGEVKIL